MIQAYTDSLLKDRILNATDTEASFRLLFDASVVEAQKGDYLSAMPLQNITLEMLEACYKVMMEQALPLQLNKQCIDVCGTGGDGKDTFNISTLSAFVCAGAGIPVAKHGNYAVSSSCGSSNVLEYLGIPFTNDAKLLNEYLDAANICILHAPLFHPRMRDIAPVRKALGKKTIFNILGPLCHPAQVLYQCTGTFDLATAALYNDFLYKKNKKYCVIHDIAGYDEISLTDDVVVYRDNKKNIITADTFTSYHVTAADLIGGKSIADSASIFLHILQGKGTQQHNAVVIANAAMAIATYTEKNINECVDIATHSLLTGNALRTFEILKNI